MRLAVLIPGAVAGACALLVGAACGPAPERTAGVELRGYQPARADLLRLAGWRTDLERRIVPLEAVRMGSIPREAFDPIDAPRFAAATGVELEDGEPVLVHRGAEGLRAWPLAHLLRRELALDSLAIEGAERTPVAVTYCSLCASARVWDRRLDGVVLELGVSGLLQDGNSLLFDRATESLWRQLDGRAVVGAHAGRRLRAIPTFTVSFGALRAAHPEALVMLPDGARRELPFALLSAEDIERGVPPDWLTTGCADPLALVHALDPGAGEALLLADPATAAAHRTVSGGLGPARGSAAAFAPALDGRALSFDPIAGGALDRETGSRWNLLGEAVEGPWRGRSLDPLPQVQAFRYALEPLRR